MQAAGGTPLTGPPSARETSVGDASAGETGQAARPERAATPATRPRRVQVLLAVALAVLALDIVSKAVVVARLSGGKIVRLLGGFLTLLESRNSGAAFSIGTSATIVFTVIAIGVIIFILRTSRRIRSVPWAIALGLLLGGATGNLTDRIFRSPGFGRGHVVDWIEVPHWPVFNLADSAIVCGAILAVLLAARGIGIDGTRTNTTGAQVTLPGTAGSPAPADSPAASDLGAAGDPGQGEPADEPAPGEPADEPAAKGPDGPAPAAGG
ncbi:MAG: signal peptidase II [Streptosporangiaceae bacterium]|jgi:signal peptidase II